MKRYLGLAIRAGEIIFGLDNIIGSKKRPYAIVIDESLHESSMQKIRNYCAKHNVPFVQVLNLEDMVSKIGVKIIGVTNKNLAEQIVNRKEK